MSDWKSRAVPATGNDWKSRAVSSATAALPDVPNTDPGQLEALARGAEQGALFGFGDELNGALSTAKDVVTGDNSDLSVMDDYRKQRDDSRSNMEAAEKAHPYTSMGGNILGAILPALLSGGSSAAAEGGVAGAGAAASAGQTLGQTAMTGAKIGALAGLGNSKADLTQGDIGGAVKDTEAGAIGGAITGTALRGVTSGIKGAAGLISDLKSVSEPAEAFRQGLMEDRLLVGKGANRSIQQQLLDSYNNIESSLQTSQSVAKAAKDQQLMSSNSAINMFPWLKGFNDASSNIATNESADPAVANELGRVKGYVSRFLTGATDEEGNQTLVGKLTQDGGLSPADLDTMRAKLASWSAQGDDALKTPEIRTFVTRLLKSSGGRDPSMLEQRLGLPENFQPISGESGLINENVPGINDLNSQISSASKGIDALPSLNQVLNSDKLSQSGTTALSALQDFLNVAPKDILGDQIENVQSLAKAKDLAAQISAPSFFHRSNSMIADTGKGGILAAGNLMGLGIRKLYDATPEALKNLGASIAQSEPSLAGQKLATMLSNAGDKDNIGRNALFYAIQQNPEYRRILATSTHSDENQ